jgi:hypothetical protein
MMHTGKTEILKCAGSVPEDQQVKKATHRPETDPYQY